MINNVKTENSGFSLCATPDFELTNVELKGLLTKNNTFLFHVKNRANSTGGHKYLDQFFKYDKCRFYTLNMIRFGLISDYKLFFPNTPLVKRTKKIQKQLAILY